MRRAWQLASVAFLALAAGTLALALEFPLEDELGPGPGFFPFWLALLMGVLALLLLVEVTRSPEPAGAGPVLPARAGAARVGRVLLGLAGAALLLGPLGFRLTVLLFTAYLLAALGVRRPWAIAAFALAASFGVFHVFYHWLQVPLPIGALGI